MSLATRCPVCQTVFRVVQDQLKVSEGWVRCGRCAKVFNAFEGLFDLEREFPALRQPTPSQRVLEDLATRNRQPKAQWDDDLGGVARGAEPPVDRAAAATSPISADRTPPPSTAPTPPAPDWPTTPGAAVTQASPKGAAAASPRPLHAPAAVSADVRASRSSPVSRPGPLFDVRSSSPAAPSPVTTAPSAPPPTYAGAAADGEIAIRDEPAPVAGTAEADAAISEESFESLFRSDGELAQPDTASDLDINLDVGVEPAALDDAVDSRLLTFVQQADRAERWRRPGVRAAMAAAALALTALLAVQLLVAQRDAVVAQWPGTRPLVQALCVPLDCRIEPLRRIDSLGVESSGLTRIDEGPVYRLVLVLHNRSDTALLMPAIDLSLTDTGGALVTRRVLSAADLGTPRTTIGAGQELPLQALLMSADRALAGYTIEIFYP
ncbi:MAG TPA: DUF3426 domain-containing protein [Burkholderiaceae bacterium]|nr:DUF3426 domain-containing protein [Burkholderiaceae bacterium]HSB98299.1 DUF3426 domain-containing protein [Burkholderiaceae bacterium]